MEYGSFWTCLKCCVSLNDMDREPDLMLNSQKQHHTHVVRKLWAATALHPMQYISVYHAQEIKERKHFSCTLINSTGKHFSCALVFLYYKVNRNQKYVGIPAFAEPGSSPDLIISCVLRATQSIMQRSGYSDMFIAFEVLTLGRSALDYGRLRTGITVWLQNQTSQLFLRCFRNSAVSTVWASSAASTKQGV